MKSFILILSTLFTVHAYACPDLNGSYEIISDFSKLEINVVQTGCEKVAFSFHLMPDTYSYFLDGKFYVETYDANMNSTAATDVSTQSTQFVKAFFNGDRLTLQNFSSPFTQNNYGTCQGKYSFISFDCELTEVSIGYNSTLQSLTWKSVGDWRSGDGRYGDEEYKLRKL